METIAISKFKATCLAVIENVKKTGQPVLITRRGEPMAKIEPPRAGKGRNDWWWGRNAGNIKILGDIISPAVDESEIEALRD
ncbi:MAG: type II toxin-antitoxin system Phd/YefM family antitoxin [Acidobacteria bacterium]|nr:MAG: type II toxin-antitoxin system Phd/YefM family antitoxin [Acidobacteriota bacterium]